MALVYDARPSTKDVDALFMPTGIIREIVAEIADEHGLESDWLNDAAKGFIDTSRMEFEDVFALSNLKVRRPGDREMLALKLASAREDSMDAADALSSSWASSGSKVLTKFTPSLKNTFQANGSHHLRISSPKKYSPATRQAWIMNN